MWQQKRRLFVFITAINGIDVNAVTEKGEPAQILAVKGMRVEACQVLIENDQVDGCLVDGDGGFCFAYCSEIGSSGDCSGIAEQS